MRPLDLAAVTLPADAPLSDAATIVRTGGARIAFVTDGGGRLIGSVTDGDVRRALLSGLDMTAPTDAAMNPSPRSAPIGRARSSYFETLRAHSIFQLPLLDAEGRIADVVLLSEQAAEATAPNRVVLMAGGLGTRLRPLTQHVPKPMLLVGGRPILQGIVERFIAAGFGRFLISVNYLADQIENHFLDGAPLGVEIDYLRETSRLGTAGCLSLLDVRPKNPIFVMNGDILTDVDFRAMLQFHEESGAAATMALNRYSYKVPYGVVDVDGASITGIREKPDLSFFVNAGVYILSPEALDVIPSDAFFDMPDLFEALRARGATLSAFPLHEYWMDIGRPTDLERANETYDSVFAAPEAAS